MKPEPGHPPEVGSAGSSTYPNPQPCPLCAEDRSTLLAIARQTLQRVTRGLDLPTVEPTLQASLDRRPALREVRGCFVTLRERQGELRGCIGQVRARYPLFEGARENTRSAALHDTRFEPVQQDEAEGLNIEISVLSNLEPLIHASAADLIARLRPGVDGVFLTLGNRSATFLPQVWDHYPRHEDFLDALCQKAGMPRNAWRNRDIVVHTYQAEHFSEKP